MHDYLQFERDAGDCDDSSTPKRERGSIGIATCGLLFLSHCIRSELGLRYVQGPGLITNNSW